MEEFLEGKEMTFIMIKPGGVQRALIGKIIQSFEEKDLKLLNMKMIWPSEDIMKQHYVNLVSWPRYKTYIKYMISGPVIIMIWGGVNAVKAGRLIIGATFPINSNPSTIRGHYSIHLRHGVIHGSDSVEEANREIKLWFGDKPLISQM